MRKQRLIKAALAVNLISGSVAAGVLFTASPGSAESPYRSAIDNCLTDATKRTPFDECVEELDVALATAPRTEAADSPAPPTTPQAPASTSLPPSTPYLDSLAAKVTSGADIIDGFGPVKASSGQVGSGAAPKPDTGAGTAVVTAGPTAPDAQPISVVAPAPMLSSTDSASSSGTPEPAAAPAADWMMAALARLRECESTNNYRANKGNGYYGAYQFSLRTWRSLGLVGYPHDAEPAAQDRAAIALQARDGWSPWPACSRKLGLR